jgi:hypothetical protein
MKVDEIVHSGHIGRIYKKDNKYCLFIDGIKEATEATRQACYLVWARLTGDTYKY